MPMGSDPVRTGPRAHMVYRAHGTPMSTGLPGRDHPDLHLLHRPLFIFTEHLHMFLSIVCRFPEPAGVHSSQACQVWR